MSITIIFLLIAVALGAFLWALKAPSRGGAALPPALFDVGGRSRAEPEPVRATASRPDAARGRTTRGQPAARGRVKNPDAPCWVCSKSLADGHTH